MNIFKKRSLLILTLLVIFGLSYSINATVYQCNENGCVTTYNQGPNGYTWSVACEDGTHDSGFTQGATYNGDCPEQIPGQSQ